MEVSVYSNLHKGCYSVKALEGGYKGRVVAHAERLALRDARFKVSQPGRERVLRERRNNVHALVTGELVWMEGKARMTGEFLELGEEPDLGDLILVDLTYNPYVNDSFVLRRGGQDIHQAKYALFDAEDGGRMVAAL